ncbi:protein transporter YIF1 [Spizellomyces punctatus DAOM BR117]|uniref:Uncharacterized protein n=1 Tax=Spizellomyces punctatus (strain DAOM BR117) TaxID=645134 RepID=A0A0L0HK62_SPIPD|nr:protein transporter YIF1 [Spizellomyces punctatus DAOM BR117]KND01851.1 hypothetical protein SPPG_03641 [Spizellomyces punctatus DAOM BR117]|eukprot:XP_016609890.1 hypothetical protein SPPG_03641 [Spizellomyces punctatus DAOM BR117]
MYNSGPPTPSWSPPPIQAPVPQHPQRPVGFTTPQTSFSSSPQLPTGQPQGAAGGPRVAPIQANRSQSGYGAQFPPAQSATLGYAPQPYHRQPTHQGSYSAGGTGGFQAQQMPRGTPGPAGGMHQGSFGVGGSASNAYVNNMNQPQASQHMGGQHMGGPSQQNYFGSNFINEFQTSAAGQLGMQLGGKALQQAQENLNQNWNRWINVPHLKYYFNVSNSYVFNKIRLLLFPFRHQSWTRLVRRSEQNGAMEGYKPPREDLNAPDLYIPVMSFVTYILLVGVRLGLQSAASKSDPTQVDRKLSKSFSPDILGMTGTTAFFIVFTEVLFLKLGFYLLNVTTEVPFLDLIAYSGYKFIGVIATLIVKIFLPANWAFYGIFAYSMGCLAFFTLRTLKYIMLPEGYNPIDQPTRQRRIQFLFLVAGVQIFLAWLMIVMS